MAIPEDSILVLPMFPQMGPYVRVSERGESGWAGSAALAINLGAEAGLQGDLYTEVPSRSPRWAHGAGLVFAGNMAMPYVQVGSQDSTGSGFYLTQGYAWRGYQEAAGLFAASDRVRPRYWSTTITGRRERRGRARELFVSASVGHYDRREAAGDDTIQSRNRLWSIAAGLSFEANLRRGVPGPPPRPYPDRRHPIPTPPPVPVTVPVP
jgi:hypothetical protein